MNTVLQLKIIALLTAILGLGYLWHQQSLAAQARKFTVNRDAASKAYVDRVMPANSDSFKRQNHDFHFGQ